MYRCTHVRRSHASDSCILAGIYVFSILIKLLFGSKPWCRFLISSLCAFVLRFHSWTPVTCSFSSQNVSGCPTLTACPFITHAACMCQMASQGMLNQWLCRVVNSSQSHLPLQAQELKLTTAMSEAAMKKAPCVRDATKRISKNLNSFQIT